ncbi:putative histidine kinase group protein [Lasiosphaeria miniovina]|uniref:Histidine kinase group protein n=1 Tax=Lasiosphaeria miniovina TaxID=1954250 RepID=A0AA39ZTT8_9PEZI|nr:putative histidine kinase group protein [Lasiosphaeria miniovina]KAK0703440.1 putative histidine kinase group protein [Lasiosphaeria miniovina]
MYPSFLHTPVIHLLNADPRPSFVVALAPHPAAVVFTNPALDADATISDLVNARNEGLWDLITGRTPASPSCFVCCGISWTRFVVEEQWAVVGANEMPPGKLLSEPPLHTTRLRAIDPTRSPLPPGRDVPTAESVGLGNTAPVSSAQSVSRPDYETLGRKIKSTPVVLPQSLTEGLLTVPEAAVSSSSRSNSDPGWILPNESPEQRPFLEVINDVDWAANPLGEMKCWPPRLEQTFKQILVDSRPVAIYWGPSFTTIYNEAFSKLCGSKHPAMLGMPVEDAWQAEGQRLRDTMQGISGTTQMTALEDEWRVFVERESAVPGQPHWLEETYLKGSIIPILENSECLGFLHPVAETTRIRLWERRMEMLISLGESLVTARDVESYWEETLQQFDAVESRCDIPLAILYSVGEDPDTIEATPPRPPYPSTKVCRLEGALGVPEHHPIVPDTLNLQTGSETLSSLFREAIEARHPLLLQTADGTLPQALLEGLQWRGYEADPYRAAVICPIRPTREENVMGLLLLGLNPRRRYDNDYRQYISLLSQKLTTSLASIVLLEEESRGGRNAAEQTAYDRATLKEELAVQTREATESVRMFEAVAEFIPVGMTFSDEHGKITFANDAWYKITGIHGPVGEQDFLASVIEDDRPAVTAAYERLKTTHNVEFEFRVKSPNSSGVDASLSRNPPTFDKAGLDVGSVDDVKGRHVLAIAKAERASDGGILRVLTCLTDVKAHKQATAEAVRRAQQAENMKRMTEYATVGMCDMDLDGRLLEANDAFFEMCGLEKDDPTKAVIKPWETCVLEDDYSLLTDTIGKIALEDKVQTVEVRFKTTWTTEDVAGNEVVIPRSVQATLMPVRSTEGIIQGFAGCLSDVSLQKAQLDREKERKEEAIESKRQQESFIDMTSHEIRNPLSAIIHCADAITATLALVRELMCGEACKAVVAANVAKAASEASSSLDSDAEVVGPPDGDAKVVGPRRDEDHSEICNLVETSIDNAETIVECALHQKRIVDDILTMSKLDSNLLAITPITVNPVQVVQEALKMFGAEARRVEINLSMFVHQSYRDLGVTYLDFDPSRMKQVLINLLANAFKFTKSGPTRDVLVTVRGSLTRPTEATSSVQFIPRSEETDQDCSQPALQGRGDPRFLIFEVKDTGHGLSEEERKSLFQRFVQASTRTHVIYGGSGLGLFISRRLIGLQNGSIGVTSEPGVGSTFAFYIEAYVPTAGAISEAEASMSPSNAAKSALKGTRNANSLGKRSSLSEGSGSDAPAETLVMRPTNELAMSSPPIRGILAVEDNIINQQIVRRRLSALGFTTDVANHGAECLDKLRLSDRYIETEDKGTGAGGTAQGKFPLSVILMDIEMPVQDGLTCTRHIRELERKGNITDGRIAIIAVSANARDEKIAEAKEAGCDEVLVKPYRMRELTDTMRTIMERIAAETPTVEDETVEAG